MIRHVRKRERTEKFMKQNNKQIATFFAILAAALYAINVSLLNNFEIVATSLIARLIFKEKSVSFCGRLLPLWLQQVSVGEWKITAPTKSVTKVQWKSWLSRGGIQYDTVERTAWCTVLYWFIHYGSQHSTDGKRYP